MEHTELLNTLSKLGFARISNAISLIWGYKECEDYLHKLIISDREDRQGFPSEVCSIIMKLHEEHISKFDFVKNVDVWNIELSNRRTK